MTKFKENSGSLALVGLVLLMGVVAMGIYLASSSQPSQPSQPSQSSTTSASTTASWQGGASITVFAHRMPATYWAPCFAAICSAGTGPGTAMYFVLYDSSGNVVQTGFADENGHVFGGPDPTANYFLYPVDCDQCHGSAHNVVFQQWGDGTTTRPLEVTAGASVDAWYSCTNGCA